MKISRILILTATLLAVSTFAQSDASLYEFAPKAATTVEATAKVADTTATVPVVPTTETVVDPVPQDVLVADAQSLIKDKLVQKYQIALDDVITRLTGKLNMVSAEAQRTALSELHARLGEKKTAVIAQKNLDPLKQEIIVALLDHLLLRIDGLIQQSAQNPGKMIQA